MSDPRTDKATQKDTKPRRVNVHGLTIDGSTTRDMDDAIWIVDTDYGWTVTVSIADVAKFVEPGTPLDQRAHDMLGTRYFVSGNSPMLPWHLSERRLSLWPGRPHKVLAVKLEIGRDYTVRSCTLLRGRLFSKARIAYPDVPGILANTEHRFHAVLTRASRLALALLERRRDNGALAFYDLTRGLVTTEEGSVRQLKQREDTIGQVIVQEFMILANEHVARWAIERDVPVLFRNHTARAAAPDRAVLMREIADAPSLPAEHLQSLCARTRMLLNKADYGAAVRGHYGLNLPAYLHFTSPIRRYADLINHRQIRAALKGEPCPYDRAAIETAATHINETLAWDAYAREERMKENATVMARRLADERMLDGLVPKMFERVSKTLARDGAVISDEFMAAFRLRLAERRLPVACQALPFTEAREMPAWDRVRALMIEHLTAVPAHAITICTHAAQKYEWSVTLSLISETGPDHAREFRARAAVSAYGHSWGSDATASTKKIAEQRATVRLLAQIAGVDEPEFADAPAVATAEENAA